MELPTGRVPASDETLTTWPRPDVRRWGTAATVSCQVPMTFVSKMRRHTSGDAASRSLWGITAVVPALLTRTSSRPWSATVSVDESDAVGLDGDVGLHVGGVAELGGQGTTGVDRRDRVDHHGGTRRGEPMGGGGADARRRAGDEDDLAGKAAVVGARGFRRWRHGRSVGPGGARTGRFEGCTW